MNIIEVQIYDYINSIDYEIHIVAEEGKYEYTIFTYADVDNKEQRFVRSEGVIHSTTKIKTLDVVTAALSAAGLEQLI